MKLNDFHQKWIAKSPTYNLLKLPFNTNCLNSPFPQGPIPVLVRKEVGNPATYFDKSFREYQDGFSANGKLQNIK